VVFEAKSFFQNCKIILQHRLLLWI